MAIHLIFILLDIGYEGIILPMLPISAVFFQREIHFLHKKTLLVRIGLQKIKIRCSRQDNADHRGINLHHPGTNGTSDSSGEMPPDPAIRVRRNRCRGGECLGFLLRRESRNNLSPEFFIVSMCRTGIFSCKLFSDSLKRN